MSDEDVESLEIKFWDPREVKLPKKANVDFAENLHSKRQLFSLSLLLHLVNQISGPTRETAYVHE
jgi:hypothetical protein